VTGSAGSQSCASVADLIQILIDNCTENIGEQGVVGGTITFDNNAGTYIQLSQ
jgi:hypothetical protein